MSLNKWECDKPGCTTTAVGIGGAMGLRAVGWWFERGPHLLCPAHRPDPVPCDQLGNEERHGQECSQCAAELEAYRHQEAISAALGFPPGPAPLMTTPPRLPEGHECQDCPKYGGIGFDCHHLVRGRRVTDSCDWCKAHGFQPGQILTHKAGETPKVTDR